MPRCRCKSGRTYKRCCRPWHEGTPAPSPEALMRSRYTAYAHGLVDYVIATTDPTGPHHQDDREVWARQIGDFCVATQFTGLEILEASQAGTQGWVHFRAHLSQAGQAVPMEERSRFVRVEDRWLYHSAVDDNTGPPVEES